MEVEFDPSKSAKNDRERALPFERVTEVEWDKAVASADNRRDYGEQRMIAIAPMQERLYVICYVMRGHIRRIISFRKANKREEQTYEQAATDR